MSDKIEVVFLGVNDAGLRVYEWLCNRYDIHVQSLLTEADQLRVIKEQQPDYVVSCGFRHIVPEEILEVPCEGCINIHPAYLPYNRGANPNVWSIVDGTPAGATLHYMDPSLDTGDIIAQRKLDVEFDATGKSLYERLEDLQVELFRETWPTVVSGDVSLTEQDPDAGTYHRTDEFETLCRLDTDETVKVKPFLDRLRALTFPPHENATIEVDGEQYYIEIDIEKA